MQKRKLWRASSHVWRKAPDTSHLSRGQTCLKKHAYNFAMDLVGKQTSSIEKCQIFFVSSTDFACSVKDSHLPAFHPSALGCKTSRRKVDDVEEIPPDMEKLASFYPTCEVAKRQPSQKTGETSDFLRNLWLFFISWYRIGTTQKKQTSNYNQISR